MGCVRTGRVSESGLAPGRGRNNCRIFDGRGVYCWRFRRDIESWPAMREEERRILLSRGAVWRRWDPHIHAPGTVMNDQFTGINKARVRSRRGRPRHHRNPRQARLSAQRWNALCAAAHGRPRSSSDTRKRDCGQRPNRLDMGTKAGNDDVLETRPVRSAQCGTSRPGPNKKARETHAEATRKTTQVHAADVQDRDGAPDVILAMLEKAPGVRKLSWCRRLPPFSCTR